MAKKEAKELEITITGRREGLGRVYNDGKSVKRLYAGRTYVLPLRDARFWLDQKWAVLGKVKMELKPNEDTPKTPKTTRKRG